MRRGLHLGWSAGARRGEERASPTRDGGGGGNGTHTTGTFSAGSQHQEMTSSAGTAGARESSKSDRVLLPGLSWTLERQPRNEGFSPQRTVIRWRNADTRRTLGPLLGGCGDGPWGPVDWCGGWRKDPFGEAPMDWGTGHPHTWRQRWLYNPVV